MKKYTKELVIEEYEKYGRKMHKAFVEVDNRTNNAAHKQLMKLHKLFQQDEVLLKECMPVLLTSEDAMVKSQAAIYCLSINVFNKEAFRALDEANEEEKDTIISTANELFMKQYTREEP